MSHADHAPALGAANGIATLDAVSLLPSGQLPASAPKWIKVTKLFSDLAAAALLNDIEVYSLPAGAFVHAVKLKHGTPFQGGTIATYTLSVGITGFPVKYLPIFDVFQAAGNTVQGFSSTVGTENHGAVTSIRLSAVSTVGLLNAATQGSVDVWFLVSTAT